MISKLDLTLGVLAHRRHVQALAYAVPAVLADHRQAFLLCQLRTASLHGLN